MTDRILVVSDAPSRRTIVGALRHGGFSYDQSRSYPSAMTMLRRKQLAAVVVELDGTPAAEAIGALRSVTDQPIVLLAPSSDESLAVAALDAGADDVIAIPFRIDEFLARLRAAMRRFARSVGDEPIATDDFTIDLAERRLKLADGTEVSVSPTEWRILEVLVRRAGHLVVREELLSAVWGADAIAHSEYLRVYMAGLRRKVEPEPARPRYFLTVPGLGLVFHPEPVEARGSAS